MRKTIGLIIGLLLCATSSVSAQTRMQQEFEKFLSLFPSTTWDELNKLIYNQELIESREQISHKMLKRNMWFEDSQNVYNHIRGERKSADSDHETPPPHIIDVDGNLMHYEKMGEYGEVYPIGKIDVAEDIVMIMLCNLKYTMLFDDSPIISQRREFYTFRKSTQQMISAYLVIDHLNRSYFIDDFTFVFFESHGSELPEDEGLYADWDYAHRKVLKLSPDGYFVEKERQTGLYNYMGYIQDSDGYSNVRKSPSVNSEVLYQIKDSSYVATCGTPDGSWFEVVYVDERLSDNDLPTGKKFGGYIHKSRLGDFEKWRSSLRSPTHKE